MLLLVLASLLLWPVRAPAPLIFTPGEGWRYEPVGSDKKWERGRAKDQLAVAEKAFEEKDYGLALRAARRVSTRWPFSDYTPRARYLMGRCYEAKGQDERAFKTYQKLIEQDPKIENYEEVVARQYELANHYFKGKHFKLWNVVPWFPSMNKTIKMYEQIIDNGPYSPVAPQAQLKIGEAYEKKILHSYADAAKAYDKAADRYRDMPEGREALFRVGEAYNKQAKTAEYDQSVAQTAINRFTDFKTFHPDDDRVGEADEYIRALQAEQARGNFEIAKFYERNRRWDGALIYYNEILDKFPESELAGPALARIDAIKKWLESR